MPLLTPQEKQELLSTLSRLPFASSSAGRDFLLTYLPRELQGSIDRSSNRLADLNSIVTTADDWGRLDDGRWPIIVVIQTAAANMRGAVVAERLLDLAATLERRVAAQAGDAQSGQQNAEAMSGVSQGPVVPRPPREARSSTDKPGSTADDMRTGSQLQDLHMALLDAFPDHLALRQFTSLYLNVDLSRISRSQRLPDMVSDLVRWAEATGRLEELEKAALPVNPRSTRPPSIAERPELQLRARGILTIPYPRNALLVGREEELERIEEWLRPGVPVVIVGVPGSGKTALAVEYAYLHGNRYPGGVWWLHAQSGQTLRAQVLSLAGPAGLQLPHTLGVEERIDAVRRIWEDSEPALIIFDELAEPRLFDEWRPRRGSASVLVSTRLTSWPQGSGAVVVELGPLERKASIQLLLSRRAGALKSTVEVLLSEGPNMAQAADAICEILGDLPASLDAAGVKLEKDPDLSLQDYLELIGATPDLESSSAQPGAQAADAGTAAARPDAAPAEAEDGQVPAHIGSVAYEVSLSLAAETVPVGGRCEAHVELDLAGRRPQGGKLLTVPLPEAAQGELNVLIDAPGFMVEGHKGGTLLLHPDVEGPRSASFSLVGLLPGPTTVTIHLYRGSTFVQTLESRAVVAAIPNPPPPSPRNSGQARPVPQPDLALRVQTEWNAERTVCSLCFVLHSYKSGSLPAEGRVYQSGQLPGYWLRQVRALLQAALEEAGGVQPEDGLARLVALGRYFSRWLLPEGLWDDLREQGAVGSTLLIVADEEGWAPWELLHDGRHFLGQHFVVGRWPREIEDACPYEFPVGAVHVGYYEQIEQPERWLQLLRAGGAPEPILLPGGVLADLGTAEDMRGLHLVRLGSTPGGRANKDAPVLHGAGADGAQLREVRPVRLNLHRNRPLVTLSYLSAGWAQLTELEQRWLPGFLRAGCSAFAGPLWAVSAEVDAAFTRAFYARLWAGDALGMAFSTARRMARVAAPESFDWLAYVMAGDPLARPYRPRPGNGYAIVQAVARSLEDPLPPGEEALFRLALSRTPPVWYEERVIEVVEELNYPDLAAYVVARGLEVFTEEVKMTRVPRGDYYGWFTLVAPRERAGSSARVQIYFEEGERPVHNVRFMLRIGETGGGS